MIPLSRFVSCFVLHDRFQSVVAMFPISVLFWCFVLVSGRERSANAASELPRLESAEQALECPEAHRAPTPEVPLAVNHLVAASLSYSVLFWCFVLISKKKNANAASDLWNRGWKARSFLALGAENALECPRPHIEHQPLKYH